MLQSKMDSVLGYNYNKSLSRIIVPKLVLNFNELFRSLILLSTR